ncbi:MAG: hypothetical protein H3C51_00430 [Rubellimicrobium sp.]|nr:hypothetical protein [Rubellimicrobium sp.]
MADLIRPEVMAALVRWRGVLGALATGAFGFWLAARFFGSIAVIGWGLLVLSPVLLLIAVQRRRFADAGGDGPGLVELVEGRIGYFGPSGGGFVALDDLEEILLAGAGEARVWLLRGAGAELAVPLGAEGAEVLFDAFVSLPGVTAALLVAVVSTDPEDAGPLHVWRRPRG